MEPLEQYAQQIASIVETKENHQRELGRISFEVAEVYGIPSISGLASLAQEIAGRPVSKNSLLSYRWTYAKTKDLDLPEDITYQALNAIAGTDHPEDWAQRVIKEGLSSREVYFLIRQERDKGKDGLYCSVCGRRLPTKKRKQK